MPPILLEVFFLFSDFSSFVQIKLITKWEERSSIEKPQKWPDGIKWPKHFQK